jgi:hypothetical protein
VAAAACTKARIAVLNPPPIVLEALCAVSDTGTAEISEGSAIPTVKLESVSLSELVDPPLPVLELLLEPPPPPHPARAMDIAAAIGTSFLITKSSLLIVSRVVGKC